MMRKLLTLATFVVIGCSQNDQVEGLKPIADSLIDNLYVVRPGGAGMTANSAGGSFILRGRCLLFENSGEVTTPVFALSTNIHVLKDGVAIGGHLFRYDKSYSFPGLGPPARMRLSSEKCPKLASLIVGIEIEAPSVPPPPRPHSP